MDPTVSVMGNTYARWRATQPSPGHLLARDQDPTLTPPPCNLDNEVYPQTSLAASNLIYVINKTHVGIEHINKYTNIPDA